METDSKGLLAKLEPGFAKSSGWQGGWRGHGEPFPPRCARGGSSAAANRFGWRRTAAYTRFRV